jgi:hypothetical protein
VEKLILLGDLGVKVVKEVNIASLVNYSDSL